MNQLHDMTKKEYLAEGAQRQGQKNTRRQNIFLTKQHKAIIYDAIQDGFVISDKVLNDYPDMAEYQNFKFN